MRSGGKRVSFDQLIELPAAAALGFPTMPAKRSKSYRLQSTLRMATFANTGGRWLRMRAGRPRCTIGGMIA